MASRNLYDALRASFGSSSIGILVDGEEVKSLAISSDEIVTLYLINGIMLSFGNVEVDFTSDVAFLKPIGGKNAQARDYTIQINVELKFYRPEPTKFSVFSDALASLCILHEVHIEGGDCGVIDVYDLGSDTYEDRLCDMTAPLEDHS